MLATVKTLLTGVIDYAGLFPPAKLELAPALANHARYRTEPEHWMLGRFIIPASRLGEVDAHAEVWRQGEPFVFSVLGRGGADAVTFLAGLKEDLRDVAGFRARHASRSAADVLEVRLPADILGRGQAQTAATLLKQAGDLLEQANLRPFFEVPLRADWFAEVETILAAIRRDNEQRGRPRWAGFKLRTGGLEAAAFPPVERLAGVLGLARRAGVALKMTAGLHHPLRRFDEAMQCCMHGFLNVLLAAALALAQDDPDEQALQDLLQEQTLAGLSFREQAVVWRQRVLALDLLGKTREQLFLSFGSCSFDEPRDDLRALGLL